MPSYTWNGNGTLRRGDDDDVDPGDEFEADEDGPVVRAFGDLIEEVDADAQAGDEIAAEVRERVDDLLEGTVDEVADELDSGDYDDVLDAVEARADRQGVQDAVDDRR